MKLEKEIALSHWIAKCEDNVSLELVEGILSIKPAQRKVDVGGKLCVCKII